MGQTSILIGLLMCVALASAISVTYNGPPDFPGDSNATLTCQIDPVPTDPQLVSVTWFKVNQASGVPEKIAVSNTNPNLSYVYNSAPASIKDRFSVDSQSFDVGTALAAIQRITIGDDADYECEVENYADRVSHRSRFSVGVYYEPAVTVELVEGDLDIRPTQPPVETPAPSTEEPPTGSVEPTSSTTTSTTVSTSTEPQGPAEVAIARCTATGMYPKPEKFQFTSKKTLNVWTVKDIDLQANDDGTFNASATLRTMVTSELDQATIECEVFLSEVSKSFVAAEPTAPLSVRYLTSYVNVVFSKSTPDEYTQITIDCQADGNPAPEKYLIYPTGERVTVTNGPHSLQVTRDSDGPYTCEAHSGDEDPITNTGILRVNYMDDPRLDVNSNELRLLGQSLSATCTASGKPQPQMMWTKDGKVVSSGSQLDLMNLNYADMGSYVCEASGMRQATTTFTLEVQGGCGVTFEKKVMSSASHPGDLRYELTCETAANPPCAVTITGISDSTLTQSGTSTAKLSQDGVKKLFAALEFECVAENAINKTTVPLSLDAEPICCDEPAEAGLSVGVIIVIVIIVALVIVGVPLACYFIRKRNQPESPPVKTEDIEEGEKEKLKHDEGAENQA